MTPTAVVSRRAVDRLRGGHPWIFRSDVAEAELADSARIAARAMREAFILEVPLVVGVEVGRTWADLAPYSLAS